MSERPKQPTTTDPNVPLPDPEEVQRRFEIALEKVRERKAFYATVGAIALIGVLVAIYFATRPPAEKPSQFIGLWSRWDNAREKLAVGKSAQQELVELEAYLEELRGTDQEGNALWLLAIGHYREAWTADKVTAEERRPHLEKALGYLETLKEERFDELLLAKPNWFTTSSRTPVESLYRQVRTDLEWEREHAYTEPKPDASLVAVLRTSIGDIHLQFYSELASEHVRNFVNLAAAGTYNETYFHYVRKDPQTGQVKGVMGGDPYTFFFNDPLKKGHILRWGRGGVGYDLPPEEARFRINHRRGIVTSQMRDRADWDNGSQFMILTSTDRDLDRRHTPFAKVVEGMNVVDKIAQRKTASQHGAYKDDYAFTSVATRDLVVDPVTLHKVVVFENGEALEHNFVLAEGETSLASIGKTPVEPLEDLYAGRRLRWLDAETDLRPGLDIPYPEDADRDEASELGERK